MRPKHRVLFLVLLALVAASAPTPAHAGGVVSVCDEAHLLAALTSGGAVTFSCSGTIILTATISITADTTIDGSGQNVTISGNHVVRVFTVNSGSALNLNRLTIADGSADRGGGIYNGGTLNVNDSTFANNHVWGDGGGIHNGGALTVSNSFFSGNSASVYHASGNGGGIYSDGTLTVSNTIFSGNSASSGGGICAAGTLTVSNTIFSDNSASSGGGGIAYSSNYGAANISDTSFSDNSAASGGGIDNGGTLTVRDSTFASNATSCGFYRCDGGGIDNGGTLTVRDSTFAGNRATSCGFYCGSGGGIYNGGTLTVNDSTFSDNDAWEGGGIRAVGTLTVSNTTFVGNFAIGNGGGINYGDPSDGTVNISNSTFADNNAWEDGGGIYNPNSGTVTLRNTIVTNSPMGGPVGGNCFGDITDGNGNLSYPDTTCPGINADPKLGPLQNNLGPTHTMALLPGSAALDAADDAICAAPPVNGLDQRGIVRPQGQHCDIGAYEATLLPMLPRAYLPLIMK
jgi:predicted outer membrane repeat protein